jgi:hypothetical protein
MSPRAGGILTIEVQRIAAVSKFTLVTSHQVIVAVTIEVCDFDIKQ